MSGKPQLNVAFIGHVGSGKSSVAGNLMLRTGSADKKTIEQNERDAASMNKESSKYAWVLDKLPLERGCGMTIDIAVAKLEISKYLVNLTDCPGNRDYIQNMITGSFYSDCVVLVVDASAGAFEAGMAKDGQTREHASLAFTMGVRQMIVAVNKMDAAGYDQKRFEDIKKEVSAFLKKTGFNPEKVPFVPVSGWTGDNLAEPSRQATWYTGPTLAGALDAVEAPKRATDKPLRMAVQDVYKVRGAGPVPAGRIEAGTLRAGMTLRVLPGGFNVQVKAVQQYKKDVSEASAGDNVAISLKGEADGEISRGCVLCDASGDDMPAEASSFQAQLLVQHPGRITVGYSPTLDVHSAHVPCRISALLSKLDRKTGKEVEKDPAFLQSGDVAIVELVPLQPLLVEPFADYPALGRFALRDLQQVVGLGVIKSVTRRQPATKAAGKK